MTMYTSLADTGATRHANPGQDHLKAHQIVVLQAGFGVQGSVRLNPSPLRHPISQYRILVGQDL